MAVVQALCSSPSPCCRLFAIFLIIITSPREKVGNIKRHRTESVNFATQEQQKQGSRREVSIANDGRLCTGAEPPRRIPAGVPLNRGKTRGYLIHSVVGDRLMRMWENINSPVRGDEGYTDPSS